MPAQVDEVLELVEAATARDGVAPLSEQSLLALRRGAGTRELLLEDGGRIIGLAHLEGASGELVVHPDHRRRGHGRALLAALRAEGGSELRIWAHGDLPAAASLAASSGLARVRVLLQMRRRSGPLPDAAAPEGIRIRTFEAGRDETAWLEANRRAFADHPEQGGMTRDDLRDRIAEPWFDPLGFFLAERTTAAADELLAGFHWTKVHPDGIGEVYVVGVDPAAQGLGLGRTLTVTGLRHLQEERGVPAVLLYVDESNTAAVRLYEKLGFTRYAVDVMYADVRS